MEHSTLFKDVAVSDLYSQIMKDVESQASTGNVDPLNTIEGIIKADSFRKLVSTIVQKTQSGEVDLGNLISGMGSVGKLLDGMGLPPLPKN